MPAQLREKHILRVLASVAQPMGDDIFQGTCSTTLKWIEERAGKLPGCAYELSSFELEDRPGRPASGVVIKGREGVPEYCVYRLDDPDKNIPGRIWTTEITVAKDDALQKVRFAILQAVCLGNNDFGDDIAPAVPKLIHTISNKYGLTIGSRKVSSSHMKIESDGDIDYFMDLLLDKQRRLPIYLITQTEKNEAFIEPKRFALQTSGLAIVASCLPAPNKILTHRLTRKFTAWDGAVRTYNPNFDFSDSQYQHPIALPSTIKFWDSGGPAGFTQMLIRRAATASVSGLAEQIEIPRHASVKAISIEASRLVKTSNISEQELNDMLKHENAALKTESKGWQDIAFQEEEQKKTLEDSLSSSAAEMIALRERISYLEKKIRASNIQTKLQYPKTFDCISEWIAKHFASRIVMTGRSLRAVKSSPFESPETVYKSIQILAERYRDMRLGKLDQATLTKELDDLQLAVRDTFHGAGAGKFGDTYFVNYSGQKKELNLHLKTKSNTRDPKRCLRIYFFWDDETKQIVIGHLTTHLATDVT